MVLCVTVVSQWLYSACDKSSATEQKKTWTSRRPVVTVRNWPKHIMGLFMGMRRELSRKRKRGNENDKWTAHSCGSL
jgi:hypothetical protein